MCLVGAPGDDGKRRPRACSTHVSAYLTMVDRTRCALTCALQAALFETAKRQLRSVSVMERSSLRSLPYSTVVLSLPQHELSAECGRHLD